MSIGPPGHDIQTKQNKKWYKQSNTDTNQNKTDIHNYLNKWKRHKIWLKQLGSMAHKESSRELDDESLLVWLIITWSIRVSWSKFCISQSGHVFGEWLGYVITRTRFFKPLITEGPWSIALSQSFFHPTHLAIWFRNGYKEAFCRSSKWSILQMLFCAFLKMLTPPAP